MLEIGTHGTVQEIRLNRPPANALSPELVVALRGALAQAEADGAEAIVLSGSPKMFSAGLDVPHLLTLDRPGILDLWRELYALLRDLAACPVPVAAAITGHSPAGGAVMAIFCDHRVMAESADPAKPFRIGLNEVQVGLAMPPVIFRGLRHLVGERQAGRLCTEGLLLTSAEARAVGLVDALVAPEAVVPAAVAWCQGLLKLPRRAMLSTRAMARDAAVREFDQGFEEVASVADLWFEPETQAGLEALVASLGKKG